MIRIILNDRIEGADLIVDLCNLIDKCLAIGLQIILLLLQFTNDTHQKPQIWMGLLCQVMKLGSGGVCYLISRKTAVCAQA